MIAQVETWWQGRSARERNLLAVLAALLVLMIGWFGIIAPLDRSLASARLRLDTAVLTRGRVLSAAEAMRQARRRASGPAAAAGLTDIVAQSATAAGLVTSRLDMQGEDRVAVALATARSQAFFIWLRALDAEGVIVDHLTVRTNSDATLAVDGVLRRRGR